jgi:hypothetical protein
LPLHLVSIKQSISKRTLFDTSSSIKGMNLHPSTPFRRHSQTDKIVAGDQEVQDYKSRVAVVFRREEFAL